MSETTSAAMEHWILAKAPEDWIRSEEKEVGQGGQGIVHKVRHRLTKVEGCIKTLKNSREPERRSRFFKEATSYFTCEHPGIPRMLQSNAQQYERPDFKLFIVTEFIEGPTLSSFIKSAGPLSFVDASALLRRLLDILAYIHINDIVHRDIKPDNIILRGGRGEDACLVDFGLSYKDDAPVSLATETGQELGNRFLRLPELSVGSHNKRDRRSDIAFAGGVLFYALTARVPATLFPRMPHQESPAAALLRAAAGHGGMDLLAFLDRALAQDLLDRFPDAEEMRRAYDRVIAASEKFETPSGDSDRKFVLSHVRRPSSQIETQMTSKVEEAVHAISTAHRALGKDLRPMYVDVQQGPQRRPREASFKLSFHRAEAREERCEFHFLIQALGDEILVTAGGRPFYRTKIESPNFGEEFEGLISDYFFTGVRQLIEDSLGQVATRGFFFTPPLTCLVQAIAESERQKRPLFLVIFDSASPTFSKLDHALGYFMEHQATKALVETHFITAIVPLTQVSAARVGEAHAILEQVRWVVRSPGGDLLADEKLHANPDVGLERVSKVLDQFAARTGSSAP